MNPPRVAKVVDEIVPQRNPNANGVACVQKPEGGIRREMVANCSVSTKPREPAQRYQQRSV
jgi:hypothetical protein